MAAYNKYDQRLESLVMETRTFWGEDVADLSEQDRAWIARRIHERPDLAGTVNYERSHTGFTREITVTAADIARLYEADVAAR